MHIQSFKAVHWFAIIISIATFAYVAFHVTTAEAVYSRTVGTISVTQFVPNGGTGYEFVTLAFSGIVGNESTADLEGWTLQSSSGFNYNLSAVVLPSVGSVKICEEGVTDSACLYNWHGNDVFIDAGDALRLVASDGTAVINISYEAAPTGKTYNDGGSYLANVYTPGDKVRICELQKNGTLKVSNANVQKITKEVDTKIAAAEDIVPPFVYERNKTLAYHPGINWPSGRDQLNNDCN